MFFQFTATGIISPVISLYLGEYLHFSPYQVGLIISMSSIASLFSLLISTFIADRMISSENLLIICHFASAIVMIMFSFQTNFLIVMILYLIYNLVNGPTFALVNTVTFHHYHETREKYGHIRLWGTTAWILVGWFFSYLWIKLNNGNIADSLKFSALLSFITGIYCLTIPKTKNVLSRPERFLPVESIKTFFDGRIIIITIFVSIVALLDRFYIVGISPFLKQIGFEEYLIMPVMTLGQVSEILSMTFLAFFIKRLGFKKVFAIGVSFEILRYFVFSLTGNHLIVISALFVHGITYAFIYVPMLIYLDVHCDRTTRAGVIQLNNIFVTGISGFLGNILCGFVGTAFTLPETGGINYFYFWFIPLALSIVAMIFLLISVDKIKVKKKQS
jgi:MFS family permease